MKKKKGFTLIELLAVIVILAVIALITIPLILGIIEEAKIGALKDSVYGIESAAEFMYAKSLAKGEAISDVVFTLKDGSITSSNPSVTLDFKGDVLSDGQVVVEEKGRIRLALYHKSYCVTMTSGQEVKLEKKEQKDCVLPDVPDIKPSTEVKPDGSGAAVPELAENMIPIKWDGEKWIKADVTVSKDWYNYDEKRWANAVTVTSESRKKYVSADVNTEIKEEDILTYLVWIPRYKYKLFNVEAVKIDPQTIDVVFENKTTAKSTGNNNGEYLTHPAFTFGDKELNGMWVGKFKTTGSISSPCIDEACTTAELTIKPNVTNVRNQTISSMFYASRSMQRDDNEFGFTNQVDTHIMKNTEWGGAIYLTYSKYGKNSEIWTNSSSNNITGCTGSTTGNIYGICDMSGGDYEYVMGAMYNVGNDTIMTQTSGFEQSILDSKDFSKYIDKYKYGTTNMSQDAYNRRILGDATGETRAWISLSYFVNPSYAWFYRTAFSGFSYNGGYEYETITFRIVVV